MNRKWHCSGITLFFLAVLLVQQITAQSGAPVINSGGVVEAAGFTAQVAAGGIASIFGTSLAPSVFTGNAIPLPTVMNTVSVKLNGELCPLFYVSPNQINFQVRWEVLSLNSATLLVTTSVGTSAPYTLTLSSVAPGVFTTNTQAQSAALIANSNIFAAPVGSIQGATSRPAKAGEYISVYSSGLGDVTPQPLDGQAPGTGKNVSTVRATVRASVGGAAATVNFAGLAPGFVGLYQVDVLVPTGVSGSSVALTLFVNNVASNVTTIAVQ